MYIFEINPLSVASFAIIFSQSEGRLFTLRIVSFAVQKLLSYSSYISLCIFMNIFISLTQKLTYYILLLLLSSQLMSDSFCDPITVACQASLSINIAHGFAQTRVH